MLIFFHAVGLVESFRRPSSLMLMVRLFHCSAQKERRNEAKHRPNPYHTCRKLATAGRPAGDVHREE